MSEQTEIRPEQVFRYQGRVDETPFTDVLISGVSVSAAGALSLPYENGHKLRIFAPGEWKRADFTATKREDSDDD